jgi:adenosylhomocysteine nucleosidase
MSFEAVAHGKVVPRVAIVAALALERHSVERQRGASELGWEVHQCGLGIERAHRCAEGALAAGASALVSWGLVGGLAAPLVAGTVVVPREVLSEDGAVYATDAAWRSRLEPLSRAFPFAVGRLLTVSAPLESRAAKAAAAARYEAVAVDMEAVAVAAVAARAGVPFVAVRVIVDTLDDALPAGVAAWIDAQGNPRRLAPFAALTMPREWAALWRLATRFRAAQRSLRGVAEQLASERLLSVDVHGTAGRAR